MSRPIRETEAVVERFLVERVRQLGGMTIKTTPTVKGMPDRLVILPGNRMYLVELKAPDGRLSVMQEHFHEVMSYLGVTVAVLWSRVDVVAWLRQISDTAYAEDEALRSAQESVIAAL